MKIFIKLIVLLTVLACIGPFFLKGPDGRPLLSVEKLKLPDIIAFSDMHKWFSAMGDKKQNVAVYKWVDDKGVTHYSDHNNARFKGKLTELKPLSTVPVPSTKVVSAPPKNVEISAGLTTIPLKSIPKLIDDTRRVKEMMEGRGEQIDRALALP